MKLPRVLKFDELNGEEVKEILLDRIKQYLDAQPSLQRHLTFPMFRSEIQVHVLRMSENLNVHTQYETVFTFDDILDVSTSDNPPDKARVEHGLPIHVPTHQFDGTGRPLVTADEPVHLEGQRVSVVPPDVMPGKSEEGINIDRTGRHKAQSNATVVTLDKGVAGLRDGKFDRVNMPGVRNDPGHKSDIPFLKK